MHFYLIEKEKQIRERMSDTLEPGCRMNDLNTIRILILNTSRDP